MAKNTITSVNTSVMKIAKDDRIRKPLKQKNKFKRLNAIMRRYSHLEYIEFLRAYLIYDLSYNDICREYHLYPMTGQTLSNSCFAYMKYILNEILRRQNEGEKLKDVCIDLCIEKKLYLAMVEYMMPKPKYTNPLYLAGCKDLDIFPIFDDYAKGYRPVPAEWMNKFYGKK